MSISIVVSDTVPVRVKGSLPNKAGVAEPFDFTLLCDRIDADELNELNQGDQRLVDVLLPRTRGWEHVLDENRQPVPFGEAAFRQLYRIVGLAGLTFKAYVEASGAKGREKN